MSGAPIEVPEIPTRPEIPCEGCKQPRETENSQFAISDVGALEQNRDGGCPTCRLILQGLKKCLGEAVTVKCERLLLVFNGTGVWDFHIIVDNDNDQTVSFFVLPGTHKTYPAVKSWPVGYEVPESTLSTKSVDWAKAKLDECLVTHSACAPNPITVLPNRILDVGDSSDSEVRLKETDGEPGRYLCLSHCWGAQVFLCTLKSNLAIHRHRIPLEDLPLTFRDAVRFTRLLGLRYLWIDSLCIVQDDEEDWRRQAAKMADIYANAHLTIAAAYSESARGGLFSVLRPEMHAHRLSALPLTTNTGDKPRIYARRAPSHIDTRYLGSLAASSPSGKDLPLLQRAWFFQERFLSQRVLYFTSSELAWQCSTRTACQCRGDRGDTSLAELPIRIGSKISNPREYYHTSTLTAALHSKGKEEVGRRWLSLVGDYSMLDLTFERDVFPALSGLAKMFGKLLDTPYRAGVWEGFILTGLLWHPVDDGKKTWGERPRVWRAPSWSWASAKTGVSFPSVKELLHPCEITSVNCLLRGPDPTGEVASGEMTVRGLVSAASVKYKAVSGERYSWNVYALDFMGGGMLGNTYADYDWRIERLGMVEDGARVWCLLVGVQAEQGTCYLLVLKEVTGSGRASGGTFERVGLVDVAGHKVRRVSPDGTIRMVSPFEVIKERSAEEIITLV